VLDALLDGVLLVDRKGEIRDANPEACRILEASVESIRETAVARHGEVGREVDRLAKRVLAGGQPVLEDDVECDRRGAPPLTLGFAVSPLANPNGSRDVDAVVVVIRDRTIPNTLRAIVSQQKQLASYGLIAAGIAHEVKNPLGGIRGAAELLGGWTGDERSKRAAELIVGEVDRISDLVEELMVFARGDELQSEPTNLHQVLDRVIELARMDPLASGVAIDRIYDPSIPEVPADADRLSQVFMNLLRNALQAVPETSGRVEIETGMSLDHRLTGPQRTSIPTVQVKLSDNGRGIAPAHLERLATPFFTTRDKGTGLGLAVSRHWVTRHHGTLQIESVEGEGTTVRVHLPLQTNRAPDRPPGRPHPPHRFRSMSSDSTAPIPTPAPRDGARTARILVADDESSIRFVLREALEAEGHTVDDVDDGDRALEALSSGQYDIAFLDIRMPGHTGLELLDHLRATGSETAAVVITAESTMENAVEAMKRGALDYLVKPFSLAEVAALTQKSLATRKLQREVKRLRRETRAPVDERLIGRSAAMLDIFKTVGKIAARNVPVLITGESGTGKELVARATHQASPRAENAFVAVNSAAIPRELLESELFGHERGAFTGAVDSRLGRFREADGGTLFLDEIGDMPADLQAKLLRVLQSGEVTSVGGTKPDKVDVRILAATHRELDTLVQEGGFREDLLYRLRVVPIAIPPLRERADDIPTLAEHFTHRYANELVSGARFLSEAALDFLASHDWPGNVRELENAVKRALVMSSGDMLTPEDFGFLTEGRAQNDAVAGFDVALLGEIRGALARESVTDLHREFIEQVERPLIESVLAHTAGNQIRAAAILGINRNTLRKKITDLEIELPGRGTS